MSSRLSFLKSSRRERSAINRTIGQSKTWESTQGPVSCQLGLHFSKKYQLKILSHNNRYLIWLVRDIYTIYTASQTPCRANLSILKNDDKYEIMTCLSNRGIIGWSCSNVELHLNTSYTSIVTKHVLNLKILNKYNEYEVCDFSTKKKFLTCTPFSMDQTPTFASS